MPRIRAKVNPALIAWAREDAGYSLEEAARRLRVDQQQLVTWEEGKQHPSLAKARQMAELYKRPLALFYMTEPPAGFQVARDFRRLPGEVAGVYSPKLKLELRRARERRGAALELAQVLDEPIPTFDVRCTLNDDPEKVGLVLREALGLTLDEQRRYSDQRHAWNDIRRRAERLGVLVFLVTSVPVTEVRGFAIAERQLPIVSVNRADAAAARCFTLMHELAHLMLEESSICDLVEETIRPAAESKVEVFCNAVAGAALVPKESLLGHPTVASHAKMDIRWDDFDLAEIAATFRCSREVVLRRLLTFGRTTQQFYQQQREAFIEEAVRRRERALTGRQEIRRNVPVETVSVLGRPFVELALETYHRQQITLNDLSALLGVRSRHVPKISARIAGVR